MSLCLVTPLLALALATDTFTLAWTHSVEKTEWREDWRVQGASLVLEEARVQGSGAGMEPPEGAVRRDGAWVWRPGLTVPVLHLAVSGATVSGWRLCTPAGGCAELERLLGTSGRLPAWIEIRPGPQRCRPPG